MNLLDYVGKKRANQSLFGKMLTQKRSLTETY